MPCSFHRLYAFASLALTLFHAFVFVKKLLRGSDGHPMPKRDSYGTPNSTQAGIVHETKAALPYQAVLLQPGNA